MKKAIRFIIWVIVAVLIYKAGLWAYALYKEQNRPVEQQQVFDLDKDCRIQVDTGACICRHRRTGERLDLPYSECKERASNPH